MTRSPTSVDARAIVGTASMEPVPTHMAEEWCRAGRFGTSPCMPASARRRPRASSTAAAQVDPDTRQRVLARWQELEYTPSNAARRLSFGRTLTISVVTSFLTRPQAAERLRGVEAVLSDSEFDLVIHNVETVEKRDQYLRGLASAQRTDGLLVISLPPREDDLQRLSSARPSRSSSSMPTRPRSRACRTSSATTSPAVRLRRSTCSSLGHRRIGYIGDEFDNPFGFTSSRHRFLGYERALSRSPASLSRPELVALGAHSRYEARELAAPWSRCGTEPSERHLRRQRHAGPRGHQRGA